MVCVQNHIGIFEIEMQFVLTNAESLSIISVIEIDCREVSKLGPVRLGEWSPQDARPARSSANLDIITVNQCLQHICPS